MCQFRAAQGALPDARAAHAAVPSLPEDVPPESGAAGTPKGPLGRDTFQVRKCALDLLGPKMMFVPGLVKFVPAGAYHQGRGVTKVHVT